MKRFLAVLVALMVGSSAYADTYYVRPNGSNSANGTSYGTAWQSLTPLNTKTPDATEGDVIVLCYPSGVSGDPLGGSGGYTLPTLVNGATDGKRWRIYSAPWLGNANDSVITLTRTGDFAASNVTIGGFRLPQGITISGTGTKNDSVMYCSTPFNKDINLGNCDSSVVFNCLIRSQIVKIPGESKVNRHCTWDSNLYPDIGKQDNAGLNHLFGIGQGFLTTPGINGGLFNAQFLRNRVTISVPAQVGDGSSMPRMCFGMRRCTFKYNRWDIWKPDGGNHSRNRGDLYLRDSSYLNVMVADTIIDHGPGYGILDMSAEGAAQTLGSDNSWGNSLDSCYIFVKNGDGLFYQYSADEAMVTNSVIAVSDQALIVPGSKRKATFRHNTFVGNSTAGEFPGVVAFTYGLFPAWTDTVKFMENIVYAWNDPFTSTDVYRKGNALWGDGRAVDSVAYRANTHPIHSTTTRHLINYNGYAWYGKQVTCETVAGGGEKCTGDRSILSTDAGGLVFSAPGSDTTQAWRHRYGFDVNSVYGSPQFGRASAESLLNAFENPRGISPLLGALSGFRGKAPGGTDLGAHDFGIGYPRIQIVGNQMTIGPQQVYASVTVWNIGTDTLHVNNILSNDPDFTISPGTLTIAPASSSAFVVTATGGALQENRQVTVSIYSDDPRQRVTVVQFDWSFQDGAMGAADGP